MEEKNQRVKEIKEELSTIIEGEFSDWDLDEIAKLLDELKTLVPEDPAEKERAWQEFLESFDNFTGDFFKGGREQTTI